MASMTGSDNPRWKGGRHTKPDGYVCIMSPGHPRVSATGYVKEHILVAEKALGKYLPPKAVVHHVDENTGNNSNSNLVICENNVYHMILHTRLRIQQAGGNPNTEKVCGHCKRILSRGLFSQSRITHDRLATTCRECGNLQKRKYNTVHNTRIVAQKRRVARLKTLIRGGWSKDDRYHFSRTGPWVDPYEDSRPVGRQKRGAITA